MKSRHTLLLLFGLLFAGTGWTGSAQNGPQMIFEKVEHDFGEIPHSTREVACTFEFVNEGSAPLVITRIATSCSCTKAVYSRKPILPGQRSTVTVTYEPQKKESGVFYKAIEIYSNATPRRQTIVIKGKAIEDKK